MVRSEYKLHTIGVWMFDFAHSRNGREGKGRTHPCRPAKRPTKNWQGRRHSPLSSPLGKKAEAERDREEWPRGREEERGGAPAVFFRATGGPQVGRPTRSPKTQRAAWQVCVHCPVSPIFCFHFFILFVSFAKILGNGFSKY